MSSSSFPLSSCAPPARAIVAAELSRARQTYEQRGWDNGGAYSTVPEVGHYQTATKSSALLKKLPTTAEQLNQANRRSREDIGLEGAKQQSLWNARATKETVTGWHAGRTRSH